MPLKSAVLAAAASVSFCAMLGVVVQDEVQGRDLEGGRPSLAAQRRGLAQLQRLAQHLVLPDGQEFADGGRRHLGLVPELQASGSWQL